MNKIDSMSAAVREVIDAYPAGHEFYGNQLKDDVVKIYPAAINMYPDTILRMARRHRRYAFCVVNQNDSLYKKLPVESITEQMKEVAPKIEPPKICKSFAEPIQGVLFSFFVLLFGTVSFGVSALGRPLLPPSRIAAKSDFLYIPALPMYLKGSSPFLWSRLLTVSEAIPSSSAISEIVIPSIHKNIRQESSRNQVENCKMFRSRHILLYKRIANYKKIVKFFENSLQNLDYPTGRV